VCAPQDPQGRAEREAIHRAEKEKAHHQAEARAPSPLPPSAHNTDHRDEMTSHRHRHRHRRGRADHEGMDHMDHERGMDHDWLGLEQVEGLALQGLAMGDTSSILGYRILGPAAPAAGAGGEEPERGEEMRAASPMCNAAAGSQNTTTMMMMGSRNSPWHDGSAALAVHDEGEKAPREPRIAHDARALH
jgi:hypothetical protein